MKAIRGAEKILEGLEKVLLVLFLSTMILLSFAQVVLREFFSMGLSWADVFLRHLVLAVGFLGGAVATQEGKHFVIDALRKYLGGRVQACMEVLADLFALAVLYFLCAAAFRFYQDDRAAASVLFMVGSLEVPSFWLTAAIPAGFVLLFLHFLLKAAENVLKLAGRTPE